MFLKWMICSVPDDRRAAFAKAQRRWRALDAVAGFRGQVGGWRSEAPVDACILALWTDEAAHARFMEHVHDSIFLSSHQRDTYTRLAVSRVAALFDIPGAAARMSDALDAAVLLRVADCTLKPGRADHFMDVQQSVWNPAMAATGAMLAGAFGPVSGETDRYLTVTLWGDAAAHAAYVAGPLPALRRKAGLSEDLQTISGHIVALNAGWCVKPK